MGCWLGLAGVATLALVVHWLPPHATAVPLRGGECGGREEGGAQELVQKCPPLTPKPDPLEALKEMDKLPDPHVVVPANKTVEINRVHEIPKPPAIGKEAGHPDKQEMDTLDALYRFAYKEGFRSGWERGAQERELNPPDAPAPEDAVADPAVLEEALEDTAEPASVEDGGQMSEGAGVANAMGELAADMDNMPDDDVPEPPADPYAKEGVNDMKEEEAAEDWNQSTEFGTNKGPGDMINPKKREVGPKDPDYMDARAITDLADGEPRSRNDIDRSFLCNIDENYCRRVTDENKLVLNAHGYWEPNLKGREDAD